jgi:putative flippase GtrA
MVATTSGRQEATLAAKHACVSGLGFAVDAALLRAGLHFGLEPAWGRVVSLACAMHATFLLNGLVVFRCLRWERALPRRWAAYMAANAFGNLCNYWIFVTLVSLHEAIVSRPFVALAAGSLGAWMINYGCTRFLVFGASVGLVPRRLRALSWSSSAAPARGAPGSSRR